MPNNHAKGPGADVCGRRKQLGPEAKKSYARVLARGSFDHHPISLTLHTFAGRSDLGRTRHGTRSAPHAARERGKMASVDATSHCQTSANCISIIGQRFRNSDFNLALLRDRLARISVAEWPPTLSESAPSSWLLASPPSSARHAAVAQRWLRRWSAPDPADGHAAPDYLEVVGALLAADHGDTESQRFVVGHVSKWAASRRHPPNVRRAPAGATPRLFWGFPVAPGKRDVTSIRDPTSGSSRLLIRRSGRGCRSHGGSEFQFSPAWYHPILRNELRHDGIESQRRLRSTSLRLQLFAPSLELRELEPALRSAYASLAITGASGRPSTIPTRCWITRD